MDTNNIEDSNVAVSELSDVTLDMNIDGINDICSFWKQKISSIDIESINVEADYSSLLSCDVMTAYIPSLKSVLSSASSMVLSVSNIISTVCEEQVAIDQASSSFNDNYTRNGGKNYNGSGGSSSVSHFDSDNPAVSVDNSSHSLVSTDTVVNSINDVDYFNYKGFFDALNSISNDNANFSSYLNDENYSNELKTILLGNALVSDDIKKVISDMDPKTLQVCLNGILNNKKVNNLSKNSLLGYFEHVANSNGTDIKSILQGDNIKIVENDLNRTIPDLENVIGSNSLQQDLLNVYDGNNVGNYSNSGLALLRNTVDILANEKKVSCEELLTNSSNNQYLKDELSNIGKDFLFFKNLISMNLDPSSFISSIIV